MFYPTHQWQTIRPGNMLMTNYGVPLEPHLTAPTEALQKLKIPVYSHDDTVGFFLLVFRQTAMDPMTQYRERRPSLNQLAMGAVAKVLSVHWSRLSGLPVTL